MISFIGAGAVAGLGLGIVEQAMADGDRTKAVVMGVLTAIAFVLNIGAGALFFISATDKDDDVYVEDDAEIWP
jgi:hypothetical protein